MAYSRVRPFRFTPSGVSGILSLEDIVIEAFSLERSFRLKAPKWFFESAYAIEARMPEGTNREGAREMLRTMLTERFGLKYHWEPRRIPVYALVRRSADGVAFETASKDPDRLVSVKAPGGFVQQGKTVRGPGQFSSVAMSMGLLAQNLGGSLDRPVVDQTGLDGSYSINLRWDPQDEGGSPNSGFAGAVQRELGLKLEKRDLPVDVLVIDSALKIPAAN
jgi:uncharacterized protein (TIGR03435 family)